MRQLFLAAPAVALATSLARAQAPATAERVDAQSLVQSGVRLIDAGDYLGALAVFTDAYERFPSPRILINIGTTLRFLGRNAEAANTYQRFLDDPAAPADRREEVERALAEIDAQLAKLSIRVVPADAELRIDGTWRAAATTRLYRVAPGAFTVEARRAGYRAGARSGTAAAGESAQISLVLEELPPPPVVVLPPRPRARLGAMTALHLALVPRLGGAALVGISLDATPWLAIDAAAMLGPGLVADPMTVRPLADLGGYLGASVALARGRVRPRVGMGVPIFISDGVRLVARGSLGIELVIDRHLAVIAELGGDVAINPEDDIRRFGLVPAIAVTGRL